jgi:predicted dithiol-disulfide oxidoreductase (DUF899 family)
MSFPNESDEYRGARDALLHEEIELRRHSEAVAEQRRGLPLGGEVPTDYPFDGADGTVHLSELFEDGKDTLFLYNFMFIPGETSLPLEGACPSESDKGQNPIATVFVRRNGTIHHFWSSELYSAFNDPGMHPRHVDFIWPLWSVFDCTPEGRGTDWFPQLAYR